MKTINRDKIQRMVGRGTGGGGGGGRGVDLAGYATQGWVEQNYVSKAFFSRLFTALDADGEAVEPNDEDTDIANIQAMFGLWTEQYLSALGLNPESGGGGGGSAQYLGDLEDVNTAGATYGKVLTYNGEKWVPASPKSAGSVKSVGLAAPTGFIVTGSPITDSGTLELAFSDGYGLITPSMKWWGAGMSNGSVSGSMTGVGDITLSGNIKNNNNRQMDITVGSSGIRLTAGAVMLINPTYGLRIGDALLSWDSQNQCLKISNATNANSAMSVYATGGVSALGYSL